MIKTTKRPNKLSNYKWKVYIQKEQNYPYSCYWECKSETNTIYIRGGKRENKNDTIKEWKEFAKDNRIKYCVFVNHTT